MKKLLDDINAVPGITGGFIFDAQKGVLANDLPVIFKEKNLLNIGKMLVKMYATGKANFPDVMEITLYYEESLVIGRQIGETAYVIILCDPTVNQNLFTMTMNLVMEEMTASMHTLSAADTDVPDPQTASGPTAQSGTDLLENSPLAETLQGMQAALSKVVGPISKIIFAEALDEWVKEELPSKDTLPGLVGLLEKEIADQDKIDRYHSLISPYWAG